MLTHRTFREHILILYISLRGVAEAALYCAHPTFSLEGGLDGLPLRVSNEGLLRPRVARAQGTHRTILPMLADFFSILLGARACG